MRKVSSSGAASTVIFVYDQSGHLLGEYDSTGKALREYVWLGDTPLALFTPDPAGAANPPLIYFVFADHLDTPRIVVNTGNQMRWRWLAEPFGTTAPENNPSGLGAFTFNLRFPGQYFDSESGLAYNHFRDYDPTTGRYAQSDPIGLAGGINTYAYVGGNPLSYTDRQGLFLDTAAVAGATATATGTSVGVATAGVGAAAVVGVGIGYGFNRGWEYVTGQSFGGSIYDWLHPRASSDDFSPWSPDPEVNRQFVRDRDSVKDLDIRPSPYANPNKPTCDEIRARIKHYEAAIAARMHLTNRWYGGTLNPGHAMRVDILQKELEKLRKRLQRGDCTC